MRPLSVLFLLIAGATPLHAQRYITPRASLTVGGHYSRQQGCCDHEARTTGIATGTIGLAFGRQIGADISLRIAPFDGGLRITSIGVTPMSTLGRGFRVRLGLAHIQPYTRYCGVDIIDDRVAVSRSVSGREVDCPFVPSRQRWGMDFSVGYQIPLSPQFSMGLSTRIAEL